MAAILSPLSNIQLELLKLYSTNMSEVELIELKTVLSNFYADKAILKANQIWDERGYSNDLMDKWLNNGSGIC